MPNKTVTDRIDEKIQSNKEAIKSLQYDITELERQKETAKNKKNIKQWLYYTFESSSCLTEEFSQFAREYKKAIKDILPNNCEIINYNRGHFEVSLFVKNATTKKLVYISISDVRHSPNSWYNNILIRTAQHDKDWTGGSNNFTTFPDLKDNIVKLTT